MPRFPGLPRLRLRNPLTPRPPRAAQVAASIGDGRADPGEVVWAWVPFEEDASQGKDRPVLVIGREDDGVILALQMTSFDHDTDAEQEARAGRFWMDIGTGDWDARRRPSEVRLNRILRLRDDAVRREGAMLDPEIFRQVLSALEEYR